MSSKANSLNNIKENLVKLRDKLRETSEFYQTLISQLRAVEFLSSSVSLDYYDIKNTNEDTFERLDTWRACERRLFYTIEHHTDNKFRKSTLYEDKFLKALKNSKSPKDRHRDSAVSKSSDRFKEGVLSIKYSAEARRRVMNLAEFISTIKQFTQGDGYDYWENMIILSALCSWVREVIYDCSRSSSLTSSRDSSQVSRGQSVYANDLLKKIIIFSKSNTKRRSFPSDNLVARTMIDSTLSRTDLSLVDGNMTRLHNSKNYVNSPITYYLFNLLDDLKNNNCDADVLRRLSNLKFDFFMKIEHPLHIYEIHEYYSNLVESSHILSKIHGLEQFLIRNTFLVYSESISSILMPIFSNEIFLKFLKKVSGNGHSTPSKKVVQSVLSALRTANFMLRFDSKDLLKIWDRSPYPGRLEA